MKCKDCAQDKKTRVVKVFGWIKENMAGGLEVFFVRNPDFTKHDSLYPVYRAPHLDCEIEVENEV